MSEPSRHDHGVVRVQLGRPPRADVRVVHRCALSLPVVTEVPPVLDSGEPFPTRYWLTCPLARFRVSQLEAAGGVSEMDRRLREEPELRAAFEEAGERYARERARLVPPGARPPTGGVGGSRGGVKCLHAHVADRLAGNENPIGAEVARRMGPLDCSAPCVQIGASGTTEKNPEWRATPAGAGT